MVMSLRRILGTSLGFWVLLAIIAGYFVYPPMKRLKFGIDLAGGTYITLGVQTNVAIEHDLQELVHSALFALKRDAKLEPQAQKMDKDSLTAVVTFASTEDALKAQKFIEEEYSHRSVARDLVFALQGNDLRISFTEGKQEAIAKAALQGNKEVLQTRLNMGGYEEVPVYIHGKDRIVVELPDVHDPLQAKKMIGTPAMLEFRLVEAGPASSKEELLEKFGGEKPDGMEVVEGNDRHLGHAFFLVPDYTEVSGRYLVSAHPDFSNDRSGGVQMAVRFEFSSEGGDKFHALTSQNIGRTLAVLLDKKVISHATINDAIRRTGIISGGFSQDEAKELATMLKSGAFTAPVTFEEERHIGPALGTDSIHRGLISCLVGIALLFLFSLLYYRLCGAFAFITLLYNLLLLLFVLSRMRAPLTLPGIAGLVLTLGMAIDSSILIFERTKEYLAEGIPVAQAVRQGFKVTYAIVLDANITTFISGLILYFFGTGPIKGFAVTLMIGIVTTLLTGLLFLRSIFEFWFARKNVQKLSI